MWNLVKLPKVKRALGPSVGFLRRVDEMTYPDGRRDVQELQRMCEQEDISLDHLERGGRRMGRHARKWL